MAAALVGHILGIAASDMKQSIKYFKGLEHRLEKVVTLEGIDFYNDSKATNVDATIKSILSFSRKIILLLGGRDKGGDFTQLKKPVAARVKKIILLGEAREKIRQALEGTVPIEVAETMQEAVKLGYSTANPGDIVLLAPACTSFDMYQSFEHRGKAFKQEVLSLQEQPARKRD
jgi:UDP-N-acetylmuramoylalanine--D-glutamate ligase